MTTLYQSTCFSLLNNIFSYWLFGATILLVCLPASLSLICRNAYWFSSTFLGVAFLKVSFGVIVCARVCATVRACR